MLDWWMNTWNAWTPIERWFMTMAIFSVSLYVYVFIGRFVGGVTDQFSDVCPFFASASAGPAWPFTLSVFLLYIVASRWIKPLWHVLVWIGIAALWVGRGLRAGPSAAERFGRWLTSPGIIDNAKHSTPDGDGGDRIPEARVVSKERS